VTHGPARRRNPPAEERRRKRRVASLATALRARRLSCGQAVSTDAGVSEHRSILHWAGRSACDLQGLMEFIG